MKVSIIISTYNQPEWLAKVLYGFENQTHKNFEVLIADDGSGPATKSVVEKFKENSSLSIIHVWHEDLGYRKCQILNKAILAASSSYLIFTDGDCIPRHDFVEQHLRFAERGFYLSGGAVRLPMNVSNVIDQDDIISGRAFDLIWLRSQGLKKRILKNLKLVAKNQYANFLNRVTPRKATWNGGNSSGWKQDLLKVNGFDERMEYGGQDVECGERLRNIGIRGKQIVYSAICVHLDHSRGYKSVASIQNNRLLRKYIRMYKAAWTAYGIRQETPSFS